MSEWFDDEDVTDAAVKHGMIDDRGAPHPGYDVSETHCSIKGCGVASDVCMWITLAGRERYAALCAVHIRRECRSERLYRRGL